MSTDILLSRLHEVARELNAESDALNMTFDEIDKHLKSMGIGISSFPFSTDDEEHYVSTNQKGEQVIRRNGWFIGYGKTTAGWGLAARQVVWEAEGERDDNGEFDNWEEVDGERPVPIENAPRAVRLFMAEGIEHLLNDLISTASKYVRDVKKARSSMNSFSESNAK